MSEASSAILLDHDAEQEAENLRSKIEALRPGRVVVVQLPDGLDPGSCPRDKLWEFLRLEAEEQGVNLPEPTFVTPAGRGGQASA